MKFTEALAVGDRAFVERTAINSHNRRKFEYDPVVAADKDSWAVREDRDSYSSV